MEGVNPPQSSQLPSTGRPLSPHSWDLLRMQENGVVPREPTVTESEGAGDSLRQLTEPFDPEYCHPNGSLVLFRDSH